MANFLKINIQLFAGDTTDKSKLTSTAGNYGYLQASFEEVADSVNTNTNKNKVKAKAILTQKTGSWAKMYTPLLEIWWYDNNKNKSGVKVATTEVSKLSSGDVKTAEGTIEVEHLSDGSLKGYAKAKWIQKVNNTLIYKDGEVSTDNIPLTTIPRANTFKNVPDSANVGQGFTVALDKKSNSFSTKLVCTCNGKSELVETTTNSATFFLPKATFASAFGSNESKKTATITATTYNGTTQIGDPVTDTIVLHLLESDYEPVVSISAVDSNTTAKTLTGDATGRTCVLNASTIVCTVSAAAQNNATLSSVTINGKNVATTTTSYTINNPTTNVFTITASDSRGFSNTATDTLSKVVDYFKPTVTANFKRNTPTDGKVKLTYSGKVFNQSFGAKSNELSFYYDYKLKSASSYTSVELKPKISGNTFSGSLTLPETYDYQQNYSFRLRVVDSLNTVIYAQDVAKGEPVLWWNENSVNVKGSLTQRDYPVPFVRKSKNLFNIKRIPSTVTQIDGNGKIVNNGDGTLTITNNTNNVGYTDTLTKLSTVFNGEVGKTYTFNFNSNFSVAGRNNRFYLLGANISIYTNTPFTLTQEMLNSSVVLYGGYNETTTISNFQIVIGSTVTDYDEYVDPSIYVNRGNGDELIYDSGKINNYSANEQVVGKYYDGHTIFQRTFYGASTSDGNATLGTVENLDVIIGCEGFFLRNDTRTCLVFGSDTMSVYQTDNTINFSSNKNVSGWYSLTIKYLKTGV